jgi:hypothetical protein
MRPRIRARAPTLNRAVHPFMDDSGIRIDTCRTYTEGGISMHIRNQLLALSIALAVSGTAFAQAVAPNTGSALTEADVRALMVNAGYTEINDVEFKEGVWTADAKSADGNHVELKISNEGKVLPDKGVATIDKDRIIVIAQEAGYKNVHDVEFEGGVWKVEAENQAGTDVELKMDPNDGHILGSEADKVDN